MGTVDDFPGDNPAGPIEAEAAAKFEEALCAVGLFALQGKDRHDYGTDYHLEVVFGGSRTNVRVHAQLKGNTETANADGTVSLSVARRNLNYLLIQPDSIYVCWHAPTQRLHVQSAKAVYAAYERSGRPWMEQEKITIRFREPFDERFQQKWHERVLARSRSARDSELAWARTPPERLAAAAVKALPSISVPEDPSTAQGMLRDLYDRGKDRLISSSFDGFKAVLGDDPNALDLLFMAEINKGLNGTDADAERLRCSIEYFNARLRVQPPISRSSISYCLGNAYLALSQADLAVPHFQEAIRRSRLGRDDQIAGQCFKNLGAALDALQRRDEARDAYERALTLDPDLAEAHLALGLWYSRDSTDLDRALSHLDRVSRGPGSALSPRAVSGWRAKILFQLGRSGEAFAAIRSVVESDHLGGWEWYWSAGLVHDYGIIDSESTAKALEFWRRFLKVNPDHPGGLAERFACAWLLHQEGRATDISYPDFKAMAVTLLAQADADQAGIWDRLGHWAQKEGSWTDAQACYRQAFELEPERYAFCLGCALNHLDRWADSLGVLLPYMTSTDADAMPWFQVAFARERSGDTLGAIEAYRRAIEIDPAYSLAHFNLGGVLWNSGDRDRAAVVWREAMRRFPEHELTKKLALDLPSLFG